MWPPRTSTETSTRGPKAAITESRKSMSRNAAVPTITRSAPARRASRTAARGRAGGGEGPQAAAVLHGHAGLARDPAQVLDRARAAGAGTVEVDDVKEPRAGVDPRLRGRERVVVVDRPVLEAALHEPHRLAVEDV